MKSVGTSEFESRGLKRHLGDWTGLREGDTTETLGR